MNVLKINMLEGDVYLWLIVDLILMAVNFLSLSNKFFILMVYKIFNLGKHVVFGQVIKGLEYLDLLEK